MHEVARGFCAQRREEIAKLSGENRLRVAKAIRSLEDNPFSTRVRRLKGREEFRVRVGDYRVLYTIDHDARVVTISAIGHGREVYR
jgi:mRNA interferase RelE/StbE